MKNPILGKVKSRLAKDIGEENALQVYKVLLEKCKEESLKVDAERHLYYHEKVELNDHWPNGEFHKHLQIEGDLGDKMFAAFQEVSESSLNQPMILIGSDCFDLDHQIITTAFMALEFSDLVIGPANDGGYYLIGIKNSHRLLFDKVDWSTNRVLEQTIERAESLNLNYFLLEELIDLDTFADLQQSGYPDLSI